MPVETAESLPPEEAFAVLGNEIRIDVLRTLAAADEPLAFSELYDRVDVADSGQFNYHLDQTLGHFVVDGDDGYRLADPGRRVVEAVLSGAVTDRPEMDRRSVDAPCPNCGGGVQLRWGSGGVELFCTSCDGRFGERHLSLAPDAELGYLGRYHIPPAGRDGRDADELLTAAWTWTNLEVMAVANNLCPRCSATLDRDVRLCDDHAEGVCPTCDRRTRVGFAVDCSNCPFATGGEPVLALVDHPALLAFETRNGIDPVSPDSVTRIERLHGDYEETVHSVDPLRASYTFRLDADEEGDAASDAASTGDTDAAGDSDAADDSDAITLEVDETLSVVAVDDPASL